MDPAGNRDRGRLRWWCVRLGWRLSGRRLGGWRLGSGCHWWLSWLVRTARRFRCLWHSVVSHQTLLVLELPLIPNIRLSFTDTDDRRSEAPGTGSNGKYGDVPYGSRGLKVPRSSDGETTQFHFEILGDSLVSTLATQA